MTGFFFGLLAGILGTLALLYAADIAGGVIAADCDENCDWIEPS